MPQKQPDVLFIVLDTVRRDRLSIYGHTQETTPAFDAFAAEATLFERAVAPAQWTVPSHTSMFTGLYPSTHQVTQSNSKLSSSYPTLAEILRDNGYHTSGFCNNPLVGVLDNGLQRGFENFYNYAGAAPNRPQNIVRNRVRQVISRRWHRFAMHVSQYFAQSDWLFRQSLNPWLVPLWTRYINYTGNTQRSIDDLMAYMEQRRKQHSETPNFTFLNLMGAHLPYRPPQDYLDRFAPEISKDKQAFKFMTHFNADAARWASPVDEPLNAFERHIIDGFYNAEIAYQDYHVGRLLRYLKETDALKDTMVIICADHGEGHGDHNFFGHSFVVYQELVHVPLTIHYPERFPVGERVSNNISTRRLFHTVLDAAQVKPPLPEDDPNANIKGLSLAQTIGPSEGRTAKVDHDGGLVFSEAFPPSTFVNVIKHRQPAMIPKLKLTEVRRGVYDDAHKLAVVADHVEGFFNVEHDPSETQDIANQHGERVTELQAEINTFVQAAEQARADDAHAGHISDEMMNNLRALGYIE